MTKSKKAAIVKKIRKRGGFVPKGATIAELEALNNNLKTGKGWVIRVHRPPQQPFPKMNRGETYWVPNSNFASDLLQTNLVFSITRTNEPPEGLTYLAIPTDWGVEEEE